MNNVLFAKTEETAPEAPRLAPMTLDICTSEVQMFNNVETFNARGDGGFTVSYLTAYHCVSGKQFTWRRQPGDGRILHVE